MSMPLAHVRFLFARLSGLFRRGMNSVRTRGWQATWSRLRRHWSPALPLPAPLLYAPAPAPFAPFELPRADAPRASIVIPVYNHATDTLDCLRALAAHPPQASMEVIVVDDGSSDETEAWMRAIDGLRYHRRAANGGFIAACNDGAALARGDYLVLLNNDTVPQPGWLDALLATFEAHPRAGLVGAQLIYPDGRLQEAGGVVMADGAAWNYGRFDSPDDPRYASLRAADYCSGAALAVPTPLFRELGGFDTRYAPAYYEDTDLAFAVRAAGREVLYQPRSRVVHREGVTAGTDPSSGVKAYQARNQGVFAAKWADALQRQLPARSLPSPGLLARDRPQILIIEESTPRANRDSGSLRLLNLMRLLIEEGAHVVFLPADLAYAGADTQALQDLGVECWYAPFAGNAPAWLREHGARFDTVMVSRHHVANEFLPLLRKSTRARVVFDTVDLHYLRERRAAETAGDAALLRAAERTRADELRLMRASDITLVVSAVERSLLATDVPDARVEVVSNLHRLTAAGGDYASRRDLVFVGGFQHAPNLDAMRWYLQAIHPRVHAQLPDVSFHCIGDQPPADIRAFDGSHGVRVHGHVADLDPYMDQVRVALAPLRFGAGVKGKINLSMAHGQPIVATTCAVEGMSLQDGRDVLVVDTADAFADAIVTLYRDEALWTRLSAAGRDNVARHFSLDAARETVRTVFGLTQAP
ncbi:glycosyltransferase [Pseudoxanthomonas indica]|uniref:Glycosyltransferase, GT2 family n=1 Tax=Pseudoxanthomonas indica TaxID=428993 RepID=A0A1T5LHX1_9GAMM|nr:glycosyltransferase [Pseudoxanthomonas indica]GGD35370.1 glycosyl transferase family protein [Pseudoxanthomonas indica]SKC75464.1 Glycosyltransferase, GT2 family [Pseudoxanthomonas indica]